MKLTTESGGDTPDPTPEAIEKALAELDRDNGFLTLGREEEDYVQAAKNSIEYRADGRHWRHVTECPDAALVRKLLFSYYADDGQWKQMVPWQDVTDEVERSLRSGRTCAVLGLMLFLVAAVSALWYATR